MTRPSTKRCTTASAGTITVELVLLTPLLLALLSLIVGLGRAADARGRLTGAARDAARAASLTSNAEQARDAASRTALADLAGGGLACRTPTVSTDTRSWRPGGQVSVTIRCTLDLSDLLVSGLPGRRTLTATATAPLDRFSDIVDSGP